MRFCIKKVILTSFFFLSLFSCNQLFSDEQVEERELYGKLRNLNMRSFTWEEEEFSSNDYMEYLQWYLNKTLNPKPRWMRGKAFHFYQKQEEKKRKRGVFYTYSDQDVTTWENLDLFCAAKKDDDYVAKVLGLMKTELARVSFFSQLAQPTTDVDVLAGRQEIIKTFLEHDDLRTEITDILTSMQKPEAVLLTLWQKEHFRQSMKRNYFSLPGTDNTEAPGVKQLNANTIALLIKNILGHQGRLQNASLTLFAAGILFTYGFLHATHLIDIPEWINFLAQDYKGSASFLIPLIWRKTMGNRWVHAFLGLFSGCVCAGYAFEEFKWTRELFVLEKIVHILTIRIAQYLRATKRIYRIIKEYPVLAEFDEFKGIITFFENDVKKQALLDEMMNLVEDKTVQERAKLFSNKGVVLRLYDLTFKLRKNLEEMLQAVAKVDVYSSCGRLLKKHQDARVKFCFAQYANAEKPFVDIKDFWHPLIDASYVVPNDIMLGISQNKRNMIITGPNAGGKSCVLKSVSLCLLLAQSFGIAPASSMVFTPFTIISTHLNIADDINAGNSLFKSEVLRAQQLIDTIEHLEPGQFSFTAFDELFKGTSPVEGTAAAYGVAKHLGTLPQSMCMVATHFDTLTKLEQATDSFGNYKVMVIKNDDGSIEYPYKLYKGVSDQHVALDIIKNEGITGTVVQEAQQIMEQHLIKSL